MVKHTRAERHEDVPQAVIAIGNDYPAGYFHPPHRHRRSQLLYAEYGTMAVETEDGGWIVPPHEAVWIPDGILHSIRMQSAVATRSVYFDRETSTRYPARCQVVGVSPLLRQLLIEAADLPTDYDDDSRAGKIMALILEEVLGAPALPLCVPIPRTPKLSRACQRFVNAPSIAETIDDWCAELAMSRRSFTRQFRRETGLGFSAWQRRACLQAALPRLAVGDPVTDVALDLGYATPAAFTAMFGRLLGSSPTEFARRSRMTFPI